jgi:hypothetical protein
VTRPGKWDELADQLEAGAINPNDIDVPRELAIIGLRTIAEEQRFAEEMRQVQPTEPGDPRVSGITRLLVRYPKFIDPVEELLSTLAQEEMAGGN